MFRMKSLSISGADLLQKCYMKDCNYGIHVVVLALDMKEL